MNSCDDCGIEFSTPAVLLTHVLQEHTRCAFCRAEDTPYHTNADHSMLVDKLRRWRSETPTTNPRTSLRRYRGMQRIQLR